MAASVTLKIDSTSFDPSRQSYRVVLEITHSNDIPKEIFVKQRVTNFKLNTVEDYFVAVATPAQIEDFALLAPNEGSSYWRDSKIDLVSRNPDYLTGVIEAIQHDVEKLVKEWTALGVLSNTQTIEIAA